MRVIKSKFDSRNPFLIKVNKARGHYKTLSNVSQSFFNQGKLVLFVLKKSQKERRNPFLIKVNTSPSLYNLSLDLVAILF